jgi:FAD:protein FMN transferase
VSTTTASPARTVPVEVIGGGGGHRVPATAGAPAWGQVDADANLVHLAEIGAAMGGQLGVHIATDPERTDQARVDARRAAERVRAWARLLTRHDPASDLSRLNRDSRRAVPVGPTLAAALEWGRSVGRRTGGLIDVAMLAERIAAEDGGSATLGPTPDRGWSLVPRPDGRPGGLVTRRPGLAFDLDGIGKGWLADRALRLLGSHPGALVDADGDLSVRVAPGDTWEVGVADPRSAGEYLAVFVLDAARAGDGAVLGLATSGTSVHRWERPDGAGHHLIDPRTGRPARTDVVQATVLAGSAAEAEAWAKCAVLMGGVGGLDLLERAGLRGAVLHLADGRTVALPRTMRWLQ